MSDPMADVKLAFRTPIWVQRMTAQEYADYVERGIISPRIADLRKKLAATAKAVATDEGTDR